MTITYHRNHNKWGMAVSHPDIISFSLFHITKQWLNDTCLFFMCYISHRVLNDTILVWMTLSFICFMRKQVLKDAICFLCELTFFLPWMTLAYICFLRKHMLNDLVCFAACTDVILSLFQMSLLVRMG